MSESFDSVSEPVPISLIAGRYLLFDVNVVTYLRRAHNICGVLIGSLPQIPMQNVFMGLPLELMPEEAKLLVKMEVAYIVDDAAWHKEKFNTFKGPDKKRYLESLRNAGIHARRMAEVGQQKKTENALARQAAERRRKSSEASEDPTKDHGARDDLSEAAASESLFSNPELTSRASSLTITSDEPYPVTPTTTYSPSSLPQNPSQQPDPAVPLSYHLFEHLHNRGYFLMPGLRFGCDYNVYPGDPLRFHSHFAATSYGWNEEFALIDLIGGGRLGTRVKKGFLIGGKDLDDAESEGDNVRTFCIEWGGM